MGTLYFPLNFATNLKLLLKKVFKTQNQTSNIKKVTGIISMALCIALWFSIYRVFLVCPLTQKNPTSKNKS